MHVINNGIDILNHLSVNLDIICLQEHWLRPGDLTLFAHLTDFDKFIHSGMKSADVHLVGCPYGSFAVLLNSSVIHSTLDIGCSINNRVQSVFFEYFNKKIVALDCDNLNVFHLKYAHPAIFTALNMLFNKMTQYGVIPNKFGNSVITQVVKNASRSLSDVCNFRPVSIILL